ncbi:MAG: hypothetical protein LBK68_00370 [Candidatus Margulisbacteria bacterium]|nr:hypothetical protein [Candidatus Margulisiibacteriota bacterium]
MAFVLAHELSHILYNETELIDKYARKNRHDMENQCDRAALRLMDTAGYNVNYAGFQIFGQENSIDTTNYGLLSTHPNMYERHQVIRDMVRDSYWKIKDINSPSQNPFSAAEIAEINKLIHMENIIHPENRANKNDFSTMLLNCLDSFINCVADTAGEKSWLDRNIWRLQKLHAMPIPETLRSSFELFCRREEKRMLKNYEYYLKDVNELKNEYGTGWSAMDYLEFQTNTFYWHIARYFCYYTRDGIIDEYRQTAHKNITINAKKEALAKINDVIKKAELSEQSKKIMTMTFQRMLDMPNEFSSQNISLEDVRQLLVEMPSMLLFNYSVLGLDTPYNYRYTPYGDSKTKFSNPLNSFKETLILTILAIINGQDLTTRTTHYQYFEIFELLVNNEMFSSLPTNGDSIVDTISKHAPRMQNQYVIGYMQELIKIGDRFRIENFLQTLQGYFTFGNYNEESLTWPYNAVLQDPLCEQYFSENDFKWEIKETERIKKYLAKRNLEKSIGTSPEGMNILELIETCATEEVDIGDFIKALYKRSDDLSLEESGLIIKRINELQTAVAKWKENEMVQLDYLARIYASALICVKGKLSFEDYKAIFTIYPSFGKLSDEAIGKMLQALSVAQIIDLLNSCAFLDRSGDIIRAVEYIYLNLFTRINNRLRDRGLFNSFARVDYQGRIFQISKEHDKYIIFNDKTPLLDKMPIDFLEKQCLGEYGIYFIFLLFHKLKNANALSDEVLLRLKSITQGREFYRISLENTERQSTPLSEALPRNISAEDFVYLLYFNERGFEFLQELAPKDVLTWLNKYMPEPSPYRDIVLNKVFKECFLEIPDREMQLAIINLYKRRERITELLYSCCDQHLDTLEELAARIDFLNALYPDASPEKDLLLERVFFGTADKPQEFYLKEYNQYAELFSFNSRKYQQDESVAKGTAGSYMQAGSTKEKVETVLWLTNKQQLFEFKWKSWRKEIEQENRPKNIMEKEQLMGCNLDELKDMFVKVKSFRHETLRDIFAGNNGLFSKTNAEELHDLLDKLFGDYLNESPGDTADIKKLKSFVKTTLHEIFRLENNGKKLRILTALFDGLYANAEQTLSLEEFATIALASYGVVGIKLAQILASQKEIERDYPALYNTFKDLKDQANPMSITEVMNAINRNPQLYGKEIKIIRRVGSASIKGVFEAEIDGQMVILKVRRASANKDIAQEESEFRELLASLTPVLQDTFGLRDLPDYSQRIFSAIREEVDFAVEAANSERLRAVLQDFKSAHFIVPQIDENLSDENILIETRVAGLTLTECRASFSATENTRLNQILQRTVLEQIFKSGFYHADLHDGNIFVEKNNNEYNVTFIDVGLCGELQKDSAEARFFKDLILLAIRAKHTPGDSLKLFAKILPADILAANETILLGRIEQDILPSKPKDLPLLIVNILDALPNYTVPDSIMRLLIAVSKMPYLYQHYADNNFLYLQLFGKEIIFN